MSQQQRAAALLRQAADLLYTLPAPVPVTSVSCTSDEIFAHNRKRRRHGRAKTGTVTGRSKTGTVAVSPWTILPRCNLVGTIKEACVRYFGTTVYTTQIRF
ncbi:hypothetical protein DPMN_145034 [Dreissena polymorpha]|uniref:Uncharacterized protein n=1 Tax=Dreissena polymorpha TaxID=45954 RepID=A0A9D4F7K3_DREPO|nr:hypothetical protein DPMN_145034 [Dreissena polymorpha]